MSYIGAQTQNLVSPQFVREVITGDGSATSFTLINDVPGFNADNVTVVVNNVVQEPGAAYTIAEDANGNPRLLDFGSGNVLATTDSCYLIHKGVGTLNITPAAGSVNAAALQDNLKSNTVDSFTGVGSVSGGNASFTLSEAPLNASSITVYVNGIFQKPTTNYSVSGSTLTFVGLTLAADDIDVHHHTVRSTVTHVADGSVTSAKLDTNIAVGGTLAVTGASTLTGAQTLTGNTTLSGTLTGGASTDIAINTNKFTVAAASGNTVIAGTSTLTGASTHTGGLSTNTISERTTASGVTIDSLKIKDGAHHLPSAATGIFRSDGSTVVLSEASNVATLNNVTLGSSVTGNNTLPSMGAWVKLQTVTASDDADVTMGTSSLLTSTYRVYKVFGSNVHVATDGANGQIQYMVGGSVFTTAVYDSTVIRIYDGNSTPTGIANNNETSLPEFWGGSIGNGAGEITNFEFTLFDPASTDQWKHSTCSISYSDTSTDEAHRFSGGRARQLAAVDGIRFYASSGNITSGYFTLYGLS